MTENAPDKPRRFRRLFRYSLALVLALGAAFGMRVWWTYHGPQSAIEIDRGIFYGCDEMPDTPESHGLAHWVRADLNTPDVELYVTPLDPEAKQAGFEYRLRYTTTALEQDHLTAAVNGTLFNSQSWYIRLPGDFAVSNETVVADHVVNHIHPHSYLLWWDDNLIAHIETTKPPTLEALRRAKWAISGQQVVINDGKVSMWAGHSTDARTMVAADPTAKLVWIACFDKASYKAAADFLVTKGAKIGVMLDGGTSVAMALTDKASGVRGGVVTGNWRPVATQFGFRSGSR